MNNLRIIENADALFKKYFYIYNNTYKYSIDDAYLRNNEATSPCLLL